MLFFLGVQAPLTLCAEAMRLFSCVRYLLVCFVDTAFVGSGHNPSFTSEHHVPCPDFPKLPSLPHDHLVLHIIWTRLFKFMFLLSGDPVTSHLCNLSLFSCNLTELPGPSHSFLTRLMIVYFSHLSVTSSFCIPTFFADTHYTVCGHHMFQFHVFHLQSKTSGARFLWPAAFGYRLRGK